MLQNIRNLIHFKVVGDSIKVRINKSDTFYHFTVIGMQEFI